MLGEAMTFATLVSLIGQFVSEGRHAKQLEYEEFRDWLNKNHQEAVIKLLDSNTNTVIGIKAALNTGVEQLTNQLNTIETTLGTYASALPGLSELAKAVYPESSLSEQAIHVLKQLHDSGASKINFLVTFDGPSLTAIGGRGGEITLTEPRWIEADITALTDVDLLRYEGGPAKHQKLYLLTRKAQHFIENM